MGTPAMSYTDEDIRALIVAGDLPTFQNAMRNHSCLNVSSPIFDDRTFLHMAVLHKRLEIAKLIMDSPGLSAQVVNAKDRFGYTPLHLAVRLGCVESVDLVRLLAKSPLTTFDPQDCNGCTPLHLAASVGDVSVVKAVLQNYSNGQDKPVNIHTTNWQGESALDIAQRSNHDSKLTVVEILECSDVNWLQLERQKSANSINAILVGATVVATVTFTTLMQPPTFGLPAQVNSPTGN